MKNAHWYILGFAITAGFTGEVWAEGWAWAVVLAIWLVRAYVIVRSHEIATRTAPWKAYTTTVVVAALSIWYVAALEADGSLSHSQARALHILNIFLVILEVYVGIQYGKHPDTIRLQEAEKDLQAMSKQVAALTQRLRDETEKVQKGREALAAMQEQSAAIAQRLQALEASEQEARKEANAIRNQFAKLTANHAVGLKANGRYCAIEMQALLNGNFEQAVTLADKPDQLRKRTGFENGQMKAINYKE